MADGVDSTAREVSEPDKRLAADWLKRIESAQSRPGVKDATKEFERARKLLLGRDPDNSDKRMRANLFYAELAMMRPQVYAKDPEFAIKPTKAVPEQQLEAVRKFAETGEAVLHELLVKGAKLKKRAKRLLTATYTTKVGWWKLIWQEDKRTDPLIQNQIKDTTDNLMRLQALRDSMDDPSAAQDTDLQIAQLQQTLQGMQAQAEVSVARGLALDFVLTEDIVILDESVRELMGDYERANAIGHRIWMSRDAYKERFGYDPQKGKTYSERTAGQMTAGDSGSNKAGDLLCVWEIWDQQSNRVFQVCEGEEGFCAEPFTPDWTGERWYPFFALSFNDADGTFYPLSDVELIEPLVREYNESRDDFVRDRRECLPLNIARKGGSLTDADLQRIKNRQGGDLLLVEGVGGQPISNDIWSGQLGQIRPENYNTQPARADIEQILGGGDAARGSVLEAKTATEAEILSQGLRGRSAERQDAMEDLLTEVGAYALQVCLRKLSPAEVQRIAGPNAVWPSLSPEDIFQQVTVDVRGGSTGKPDRLQEQDRWTKLLPVIEKTVERVAELRAQGQEPLAQALITLTRETLRRFDERIDIDQFLPQQKDGEGQVQDPMQSPQVQQLMQQGQQMVQELQAQVQQLQQQVQSKDADRAIEVEKARLAAEAQAAKLAQERELEQLKTQAAEQRAADQAELERWKAELVASTQIYLKQLDLANSDPEAAEDAGDVLAGEEKEDQTMQALVQLMQQMAEGQSAVHQLMARHAQPKRVSLLKDETTGRTIGATVDIAEQQEP